VVADADVREIATRLWAGGVDHTEIPVQKDARVTGTCQNPRCRSIGIRNGVQTGRRFRGGAEVCRNRSYIRIVNGNHGVPATICTGSTVDVLLYITRQNPERLVSDVMRGEVAPEREILPGL
jgi:hypothetical protein